MWSKLRPRKINFRRFACFLLFVFLCTCLDIAAGWNHDYVIMAAVRGDGSKAKRLARFDPYLSRVGFEEHMTPLGAAAYSGSPSLVQYFLGKGVDVNCTDDKGFTAKNRAASMGHHGIVRILEQAEQESRIK